MINVIIILSIVVVFLSYNLYGYYKKNKLLKKVKWCVTRDSFSRTAPERKMRDHILRLQWKLSLDKKYMITEEEFSAITDILKEYQQDLIQKYFNDTLPNYNHTEEVCFVITLRDFLEKHQCDTAFIGNEMYTIKDHKTYGTWGVTSFSATYVLTDYAVTYNKLYYISQLYFLKLYNIVEQDKLGVIEARAIKEAIDNRELKVNNF